MINDEIVRLDNGILIVPIGNEINFSDGLTHDERAELDAWLHKDDKTDLTLTDFPEIRREDDTDWDPKKDYFYLPLIFNLSSYKEQDSIKKTFKFGDNFIDRLSDYQFAVTKFIIPTSIAIQGYGGEHLDEDEEAWHDGKKFIRECNTHIYLFLTCESFSHYWNIDTDDLLDSDDESMLSPKKFAGFWNEVFDKFKNEVKKTITDLPIDTPEQAQIREDALLVYRKLLCLDERFIVKVQLSAGQLELMINSPFLFETITLEDDEGDEHAVYMTFGVSYELTTLLDPYDEDEIYFEDESENVVIYPFYKVLHSGEAKKIFDIRNREYTIYTASYSQWKRYFPINSLIVTSPDLCIREKLLPYISEENDSTFDEKYLKKVTEKVLFEHNISADELTKEYIEYANPNPTIFQDCLQSLPLKQLTLDFYYTDTKGNINKCVYYDSEMNPEDLIQIEILFKKKKKKRALENPAPEPLPEKQEGEVVYVPPDQLKLDLL